MSRRRPNRRFLLIYIGSEEYYFFRTDVLEKEECPIVISELGSEEPFAENYAEFLLRKLPMTYG